MIHFVSLIDIEGGGASRWDFIHPDTPDPLRERLEKYRDLASNFIYAVISAFGDEIVGDQIRELRLSEIKFVFMPLEENDKLYYAVFIVDMKDNPVATRRIFMDFFRKNKQQFNKVLTGPRIRKNIMERLRSAMAQFLVPRARQKKVFSARNKKHLFCSYLVSLLLSGILTTALWGINESYHLMDTNPILLAVFVFIFVFLLPGIPIGILTQYGRNAIIVAFLNSLTIVIAATFLWQDLLLSGARVISQNMISKGILIATASLVGIMLGTTLAIVSFIFAKYFERRRLTCIKPLSNIPEISKNEDSKPEEHSGPPPSPSN